MCPRRDPCCGYTINRITSDVGLNKKSDESHHTYLLRHWRSDPQRVLVKERQGDSVRSKEESLCKISWGLTPMKSECYPLFLFVSSYSLFFSFLVSEISGVMSRYFTPRDSRGLLTIVKPFCPVNCSLRLCCFLWLNCDRLNNTIGDFPHDKGLRM